MALGAFHLLSSQGASGLRLSPRPWPESVATAVYVWPLDGPGEEASAQPANPQLVAWALPKVRWP